jgi:site-specific DNA recombinase
MTDLAAVYVRVSTEEQASSDKTSLAQQREKCTAYCLSQGWEVAEVYEDAGVSGSLDPEQRPAMHKLLEDAGASRFKRLVFLKVDRVARSLRKLLNFSHQLQGLGIGLVSVVEQFDTSTASGQLYFNLLGAFAQFEAAQINERMSEGRKGAVRNGRYLSSTVPFGYVRENGTLKPHPQQADVVSEIFGWALEGLGVKDIVTRLTEQGVEPPNPSNRKSHWGWHHTTVYKLLTSPRYIGKGMYAGVPMPCPLLVEQETFDAVQAGLKKRKRDSPRNTKNLYLLQHLLWCHCCGGRYMAKTVSHGAVYLCRQRTVYGQRAGHDGVKWRWHAGELETRVKEHVLRMLVEPDYLLHNAQVYRDEVEQRVNAQRNEEDRLRARLTSLEQQEARAVEGYTKGLYDESKLQEILSAMHAQQSETQAKLSVLAAESPAEELTKAEKASMLASWVLTRHAVPLEGKSPDEVFASLFEGGHVEWALVEGEDPDTQEWTWVMDPTKPASLDKLWREVITALVSEVWVEDDGSLTVKGTLKAASDKLETEVPAVTPPR